MRQRNKKAPIRPTIPIEQKLVIGIASSALFDLSASHQVYLDKGAEEYRKYQEQHLDTILGKGVAFPFIKRFLNINKHASRASRRSRWCCFRAIRPKPGCA
jgi:hypothetical protein